MKTVLLPALLMFFSGTLAPAAIVFDNLSEPAASSVLVKGTGGFISTAIEHGFEFTVGGGDHYLDEVTISVGAHFGSLPLTVELYSSPTGPDSAVFLTQLIGPSQPINQLASYAPASALLLSDGETYFVRLWVNGSASSYAIVQTNASVTGDFSLGNNFLRNAGFAWGSGNSSGGPHLRIGATAVPEPCAMLLGSFGLLILFRRRR
ncbi:MAG: hypothetical protein MUF31_02710 [Akkermansiaceae bacterium]|jgi:hypothetical protein|nr:hypothetical protein [Akkermansiaceae bacterium]